MSIQENIMSIQQRIKGACIRSGRDYRDVKLVAVTKTVDIDRIIEAVDSEIKLLGENRVQEIVDKYPNISRDIEWHMIGHLQSNKVKYIVDKVSMIHSVDSIKLAEEIDKRFKIYGRIIDILVEINIGLEKTKRGIQPDEVYSFLDKINEYHNINVCGLMTIAPKLEDCEMARPYFKKMKEIFEEVKNRNIKNVDMKFLSMGMTNDFEIAIEEGANIVRVGSGIFGSR